MDSRIGHESIAAGEIVLRRILDSFMEGPRKDRISHRSFRPRPQDKDAHGISLVRRIYAEPHAVACTPPPVAYVAALPADRVRALGMSLLPDPQPSNPGHCVIPELSSAVRETDECNRLTRALRDAVSCLFGPIDCSGSRAAQ